MTWIKICGITNLEDAQAAVEAGADALGFVFYEKSPRRVDAETVREIVRELPARVEKVGVFVDQPANLVAELARDSGLTAAQVYSPDCVEGLGISNHKVPSARALKLIFVVSGDRFADRTQTGIFFGLRRELRESLFALLVDNTTQQSPGGNGFPFDWQKCRNEVPAMTAVCSTIVAGGLTPSNVKTALTLLHPWGVDVSSGVESGPGKKDLTKIRAFIDAVREADRLQ